jgi:hypothetical protein
MSSTLALLDRDHLNAMTGGDKDLALEVIDIFREQTGLWMRLMDPKAEPKAMGRRGPHAERRLPVAGRAAARQAIASLAEKAGRSETPPSMTAAAVLLGDVRDCLSATMEEVAKAAHELAGKGALKAS